MPRSENDSSPFCFLIPLQSEQVSTNWTRITKLFELCVGSIFQQSSDNFLVYVGCHEVPEVRFAHDSRLRFCQADFPPPPRNSISTEERMNDKWDKLLRIMFEVGRVNPSHIMIVDADDLVSRQLVEFAQRHPHTNGWIFERGYRYSAGSRFILEQRDNFNCGTNCILSAKRIRFPQAVSHEERMKCLALTAGHTIIAEKMANQGTPLERLPFPGSVYLVNHGDNDSHLGSRRSWRQWFKRSRWLQMRKMSQNGRWQWLGRSIREEFGMPEPKEFQQIAQMKS